MSCVLWTSVCLFAIVFTDIDLRLLVTPLLTFLKCRNRLNMSSHLALSGIRLYFSLCNVLWTNVCFYVICLRDIVLRLLVTPLVSFLKCRNRLNMSSHLALSGIRLYFSLCNVLWTNVCFFVICLRDIVLRFLITTLVTFLKCRNSLNQ